MFYNDDMMLNPTETSSSVINGITSNLNATRTIGRYICVELVESLDSSMFKFYVFHTIDAEKLLLNHCTLSTISMREQKDFRAIMQAVTLD
jgi:hypothetical protein